LVSFTPHEPLSLKPDDRAERDLVERLAAAERRCASLEAELAAARMAQELLQRYADDFRRTYAESRHRLQQMTVLYEVSTAVSGTVDPAEVLARSAAGLERLVPGDRGAIYVLDDGGAVARRRVLIGPTASRDLPETVDLDDCPLGRCLATGLPVEGYEAEAGGAGGWVLALPLSAGSQHFGALLLLRQGQASFGDEDRRLAEMVAGSTAMALQNARLATTDGLTGLYNRRYFEQALAFECERARRLGRPLGLLMIDVDHFKRFNEEHGHLAGDVVLQLVASTLGGQLRRTDIVARVGGEEFAAILPENDEEAVLAAAERLRLAVEATPPPTFEGNLLPMVRVSVGGATLEPTVVDPKALVGAADGALRRAKRAGRNRSMVVAIDGVEVSV
jgi:diguanylate cyclase (GGDEF)-like protein